MNSVKNLNLASEIHIDGYDGVIKIDFSDLRMRNKLIHLAKHYREIEGIMQNVYEEAQKIEDQLDKILYVSDKETEVLEGVKKRFEDVFGADVIMAMFGDCLPSIERYSGLLEALTPYLQESMKKQAEESEKLSKKYNIDLPDTIPAPEDVAAKLKVLPSE